MCIRVGDAFTKSRKSCALASAVVRCFGAILRGLEVVYVRMKRLLLMVQLSRKIDGGLANIYSSMVPSDENSTITHMRRGSWRSGETA